MIKILTIVGARPNFMKIAPLIHEMRRCSQVINLLVHTGQHYDDNLSKVFFQELEIPEPDINLDVGSGTREEQIVRIKEAFEPLLIREKPDAVVVVGDVNSTIACASVAKKHEVKVAHVEAGLRSFDLSMPEEHNRKETDEISNFLFVTETSGLVNLEKEQSKGARHFVGNVMIDTLAKNLSKAEHSPVLEQLSLTPKTYLVATFHRPSNVDREEDLVRLIDVITEICKRTQLVFPAHPRTRKSLEKHSLSNRLEAIENLRLIEPLGYIDFLKLVSQSLAVITDSGGIQEETTYLGVPCLTMRENTERPVTVTVGTNTLVGADRNHLFRELDQVLQGTYKKGRVPELWDGKAAARIVRSLIDELS